MAMMSREERWIKHYSSNHEILLVGEGDFSFSLCLALAFGSATNIVATSLDSYEELMRKYKNAASNLAILGMLGASLLHGVDATKMKIVPFLQRKKFHRIVYNFPHAGFLHKENHPGLIKMHRDLVRGFLWNAKAMMWLDGEIHISHKTTAPFDSWKLEELASECSLFMSECEQFRIHDFPGYQNKRGAGSRSDEPFRLGECKTFKFILYPTANKVPITERNLSVMHNIPQNVHIPQYVPQLPVLFDRQLPPMRSFTFVGDHKSNAPRNECLRMFGGYLNHVEETFGNTSLDEPFCERAREVIPTLRRRIEKDEAKLKEFQKGKIEPKLQQNNIELELENSKPKKKIKKLEKHATNLEVKNRKLWIALCFFFFYVLYCNLIE